MVHQFKTEKSVIIFSLKIKEQVENDTELTGNILNTLLKYESTLGSVEKANLDLVDTSLGYVLKCESFDSGSFIIVTEIKDVNATI